MAGRLQSPLPCVLAQRLHQHVQCFSCFCRPSYVRAAQLLWTSRCSFGANSSAAHAAVWPMVARGDRLYLSAGAEQGRLTLSCFSHLQHLRLRVKLPDMAIPYHLNGFRFPEYQQVTLILGICMGQCWPLSDYVTTTTMALLIKY